MAIQTRNGKAFEYATLLAIYNLLNNTQMIKIVENSAFINAQNFYNELTEQQKLNNTKAAMAAVKILLKLEPQLTNSNGNEPLYISIQEDSTGVSGDVRDILTIRSQNNWEIGISCKHNHKAVKHSRLSDVNDFGQSWFSTPCSINYFNDIKPLFQELRLKKQNNELWRNIVHKEQKYYIPLLRSFIDELFRLDFLYPNILPGKLIQYLLGKHDFYKIITDNNKKITHVHCFSLYGSLNRPSGNLKPELVFKKLKLPTKFLDIRFKDLSNNTILVTCDNGWAISMRIHNASSKVEPSLKFDINLVGQPSEMYATYEPW